MRPFCRLGTETYNWTNATEDPSDFHPFVGTYGINNWDVSGVTSLELMFSWAQSSQYQAGGGMPDGWGRTGTESPYKRLLRVDTGAEVHDVTGAEVDHVEWCATNETGFEAAEAAGKPCNYKNVDYIYDIPSMQGDMMTKESLGIKYKHMMTMDGAFDLFDHEHNFPESSEDWGSDAQVSTTAFNDPIGGWNTSSVTSMRLAFVGLVEFNQARAFVCGLLFCILAVFVFVLSVLLFCFVLRAAACLNCAVGHIRLPCCCL